MHLSKKEQNIPGKDGLTAWLWTARTGEEETIASVVDMAESHLGMM